MSSICCSSELAADAPLSLPAGTAAAPYPDAGPLQQHRSQIYQQQQQEHQHGQLDLHKQEARVLLGMLWAYVTAVQEGRRLEAMQQLLPQS